MEEVVKDPAVVGTAEEAVNDPAFWQKLVAVPPQYGRQRARIERAELCGIVLTQIGDFEALVREICDSGAVLVDQNDLIVETAWLKIDMHFVNKHVVKPLTWQFQCAFVELVAEGSQVPLWFVSHYWGTPFAETVAMLNYHAEYRNLASDVVYWIDTFAINQHQYSFSDFTGDLLETPFVKVILSTECAGTITLFDHDATTLQRAWCVLENFVSTQLAREIKTHWYDFAAWLREAEQYDGTCNNSAVPVLRLDLGSSYQTVSEGDWSFPFTVDETGVRQDITLARASRPEDKQNILRMIGGQCDELNRKVRLLFAAGAVYTAALRNNVPELQRLLADYPEEVNTSHEDIHICIAARSGHMDCVCTLLDAAVDPNMSDKYGYTPIMATARGGHCGILRRLLAARADPTVPAHYGYAPVLGAARKGHLECLAALLEARVDPDTTDVYGYTPSHGAVLSGRSGTLRMLLAARADPGTKTRQGETPVASAVQGGNPECLRLLLAAKADPNAPGADGNTPAACAVTARHADCLRLLLEARADPNVPGRGGETLLHLAGRGDNQKCFCMLLEAARAADTGDAWNYSMTPIFFPAASHRDCNCYVL